MKFSQSFSKSISFFHGQNVDEKLVAEEIEKVSSISGVEKRSIELEDPSM